MKPQFSHELAGSVLLWLDNLILTKGEAFYNVTGNFYPVNNFNGLKAYASPYKQIIYDSSISGANVITGVYLNNNYITTGQSGFLGINYEEGLALFNTNINGTISGIYSAKEISVKLTTESEEDLIFKKKYYNKNQTFTPISGNLTNEQPYPIVYIKLDEGKNHEFALGGEESTENKFILVNICDSQYQLDGLRSIIQDAARSYIPLYYINEYPFNVYGSLKQSFNYTGNKQTKINNNMAAFLKDIETIRINSDLLSDLRKLNPSIYFQILILTTQTLRFPRYNSC